MSAVLVEDADGVRTLTLNRPDRLNAIDRETRRGLNEELRRADEDPAVRCIVLTGAGRAFSAGADLKEDDDRVPHGEGAEAWHRFLERANQGDAAIDTRSLAKPVIAAVNGLAYGVGMLTAVECDILVAAASARFGMLEARMGSGGSTVLPFLIGPQWTRFLMYSGETIDAETAKRIGLVIEVIPDAELAGRVHDLAVRIAAMPPLQVRFSKRQTEGTLAMMGKLNNEVFSLPHQAILNSLAGEATAPDGRKLLDVLEEEGLAGLIAARDAKHEEPWLR
jgi:2-(1,2-epoxy-1,2-dihydrophenyl)acetyl-CoA isomerase